MSPQNLDKNSEFISLSEAVTLVTYTRDYLGRLAREGKIISKQINKQWLVNRESLLNFFAHSALEDSVKKRILSISRKNDLEVKDIYREKVETILSRTTYLPNASLLATVVIIACGLFSGVLIKESSDVALSYAQPLTVASLMENLVALNEEVGTQSAAVVAATQFSDSAVIETEEPLSMAGGIVIFPAGVTSKEKNEVRELFSDEVSVVLTSSTTGTVRLKDSDTSLPFVRVPKETQP